MKDIINEINRQLKVKPGKPVMLTARQAQALVNFFRLPEVVAAAPDDSGMVSIYKHDEVAKAGVSKPAKRVGK